VTRILERQGVHDVSARPVEELDQRNVDAIAVEVVLPLHVDGQPSHPRIAKPGHHSGECFVGLDEIVSRH
jgi:hypothetical protein